MEVQASHTTGLVKLNIAFCVSNLGFRSLKFSFIQNDFFCLFSFWNEVWKLNISILVGYCQQYQRGRTWRYIMLKCSPIEIITEKGYTLDCCHAFWLKTEIFALVINWNVADVKVCERLQTYLSSHLAILTSKTHTLLFRTVLCEDVT